MKLVIIEGVGKRSTVKKYLGNDYEVVATKGHVRDLPVKTLGVNILDNFKPQYEIIPDKKDVVKMLKDKSSKAEQILLATDPDREGEAISWHLAQILDLNQADPIRIEFNEISKNAVQHALQHPRGIDQNLVNAQQARRVLDRLVGYKLSPIICKKIQPKLSAGRVQSVALQLVVDRDNEIKSFVPQEYYSVVADVYSKNPNEDFVIRLNKANGKDATKLFGDSEVKDKVVSELTNSNFVVKEIKKARVKSHPTPPYTTSTMQQDGVKSGMTLKEVTNYAQQLYEGVELKGEGHLALVTYIRTDSVRIAPGAIDMVRDYINANFGSDYLPSKPNYFKTKDSAQDAHEAIRPISMDVTPEILAEKLGVEKGKSKLVRLYELIYNKFLACQMAESLTDQVTAVVSAGNYELKAVGKTEVFDGFYRVYKSKKKAVKPKDDDEENENVKLPELNEGDNLTLKSLDAKQKFTKPLSRYTEATLIKEMEDKGIGRPATYAPTIALLESRKYVVVEQKNLVSTELGVKVVDLLEKYFPTIMNVKFTASMENKLDEVANKGIAWQDFVGDFYKDFEKLLKEASGDSTSFKTPAKQTDIKCDKCGSPMVIRTGKYGEFLACSNYPTCKNIMSIEKKVGICPKCGKPVIERHSKKGTIFYGCTGYPECDFISWDIPLEQKCPQCNSYLVKKKTFNGFITKCSNKDCNYKVLPQKEENKETNEQNTNGQE